MEDWPSMHNFRIVTDCSGSKYIYVVVVVLKK